ncbi:N-alpha-acetyltransferase, non-catalitic subunit [Recurvomyces mirabilis]|nr:N-alpha-acetyltransferase, non-catalitic subunit [Recurvomyces mirabilis]
MSYAGPKIQDVTEEFAAAAKQLPPGQLVKDEYFTLFEAVGALEIMDPKMDSGFVPEDDTAEPDFDVCRGLLPTEVLWIMDQLLGLTIGWHDGYPLSQTVFTSLHVDRLLSPDNRRPYNLHFGSSAGTSRVSDAEQVVHLVLRAYCLALVKSCALVLHTIQLQNFYEEEDFVTHLFGRELLHGLSAEDSLGSVGEAMNWLSTSDIRKDVRDALSARLDFIWTYVSLLTNDLSDWQDLINVLDTIKATHHLAVPIPEAFSDKVQRQLASSTPPRPMMQVSWDSACQKWREMCDDIVAAGRLTREDICQSPQSLQRAIWAFAYRDPPPNTYARAYMQTILFGAERLGENTSFFDLLLIDIRDLVLAGDPLANPDNFLIEVPSDPRHQSARVLEIFMDKVFDEYMNIFRMVCQNRCRIRRTFTQSIGVLDSLEAVAMQTDADLDAITPMRKGDVLLCPMTCWVKYQKLQIMVWTIQLGIETDIYLPHELSLMYWLLSWMLDRKLNLNAHSESFLIWRTRDANGMRDTKVIAECLSSQDYLQSLRLQAEAERSLSTALWQLFAVLTDVRAIKPLKQDYAQELLLYEARTKPYLSLTQDPIPPLSEYKAARSALGSVQEVCATTTAMTKQAKSHLAELKKMAPHQARFVGTEDQFKREVKQMETTCVATAVQTSQLLRLSLHQAEIGSATSEESLGIEATVPAPGSRYHDWWVVPQIKSTK